MKSLCRDCAHLYEGAGQTCPCCASRRICHLPSLQGLNIAHVDCDAFYAAIEKRDRPELKDRPVIVGGGRRGVVATCCYIARLYGVRSAMPMFKALKACPDAVVIHPDFAKYNAAGHMIRDKMRALTPLVEPVSIDEAYMDLSGTERINKAPSAVTLVRLARDIERDVGVSVSIGLSTNKFLAKTASEMDKPRGFAILTPQEAPAFLASKSPAFLHGIGPKFAAKLARNGVQTVGDLQSADLQQLIAAYGEMGLWLYHRAQGQDERPVNPNVARKSISAETTFEADLRDLAVLEDHLWRLCVKTADRAKRAALDGTVVTLKLKTASFRTITRRQTLTAPTQLAHGMFRPARAMLTRETARGPYRLIGVGLSSLQQAGGDAIDLIDPMLHKRAAAERAADEAREKFGTNAVITGRGARLRQRHKTMP